MVRLGSLNSRMKDFYDLWVLASRFDFDGKTLALAIVRTFENRKTAVPTLPLALTPEFAAAAGKDAQWKGFVRKARLADAPPGLESLLSKIRPFLLPLTAGAAGGGEFDRIWRAPGPRS